MTGETHGLRSGSSVLRATPTFTQQQPPPPPSNPGGPMSPRQPSSPTSPYPPRPLRTSPRSSAKKPESSSCLPPPSPPPEAPVAKPYCFFPLNNHPTKSEEHEPIPIAEETIVLPTDDPAATRGIPVFKPTYEEFKDFDAYMHKVLKWGQHSSIIKIVPPKDWVDGVQLIDAHAMSKLEIRSPIEQRLIGTNGVFVQRNVERMRNRPLSIHEWYDKCNKEFATPDPKAADRTTNRDSKDAQERARRETERIKSARQAKKAAALKRKEERARRAEQANGDPASTDVMDIDQSPKPSEVPEHAEDLPPLVPDNDSSTIHTPLAATPEPVHHPDDSVMGDKDEKKPLDPFYETVDLRQAWLPEGITPADYTVEGCANIERKFWRTLGVGRSSWYGADLPGSLFANPDTPWNVAQLPNLLNKLPSKIPGVNSPYLYFGMWRAAFAWHVEDMDLFSINYIHFGAPKFWYAVPQSQAERFEELAKGYFPSEATTCDQFMRHKSCTLSPLKLHNAGIRVNKLVQHQNEFVVTFPRGYHAGFNMGFNCAESVNFALPCWLQLGRKAKACTCVDFSVRIDVDYLTGVKVRSPTPEPESKETTVKQPRVTGKRKPRESEGGTPKRQRKRKESSQLDAGVTSEGKGPGGEQAKSIPPPQETKPVVQEQPKPAQVPPSSKPPSSSKPSGSTQAADSSTTTPCVLCPSPATDDLAPIFEPSDRLQSLAQTPTVQAHISCAIAVPEAYTEDFFQTGDDAIATRIKGIDEIDKARWKLKCSSCVDKRTASMGTKIQCTKGKCVRAYHVSCAKANPDIHYLAENKLQPPPTGNADQEPVSTFVVELLCPNHNPKVIENKKQRAQEELKQKVLSLNVGHALKVKTTRGSVECRLVAIHEQEQKVVIRLADATVKEVVWQSIDFRAHQPQMLQNEYAKEYATTAPNRRKGVVATEAVAPPPVPRVEPQGSGQGERDYRQQNQPPIPNYSLHDYRHHPSVSKGSDSKVAAQAPQLHPSYVSPAEYGGHIRSHYPPQHPRHLPTPVSPEHHYRASHPQAPPPHYYPHPIRHDAPHHYHHIPPPHFPQEHLSYRAPLPPPENYHGHYAPAVPPSQIVYGPRAVVAPAVRAIGQLSRPSAANHFAPVLSNPASVRMMASGAPPPSSYGPQGQPTARKPSGPSQNGSSQPPQLPSAGGVGKIDLGLDRMISLMMALPPIIAPAIHLSGTNGKGSTSAMLESCLLAAKMRTARYNSPHLIEPRDAISINGHPVSAETYSDAMAHVQRMSDERNLAATTFEIGTATFFLIANTANPPVDIMIVECGMGGLRDATNILPPQLVLATGLTSVSLEHTAMLGNTITAITREKSSIAIHDAALVVSPNLQPEALSTAKQVAGERHSRFIEAAMSTVVSHSGALSLSPFRKPAPAVVKTPLIGAKGQELVTELNLGGAHQRDNLSLALTILDFLRQDGRALSIQPKLGAITDAVLKKGISTTHWNGRCSWLEWVDPTSGHLVPILVDGAHNGDSAETLRAYIDNLGLPNGPRTYIFSMSGSPGKTPESVLTPLLRAGDRVALMDFTTPVEGMPWVRPVQRGEARPPAQSLVGSTGEVKEIRSPGVAGVAEALRWAASDRQGPSGIVIVCGSLYLVADVYRLIQSSK